MAATRSAPTVAALAVLVGLVSCSSQDSSGPSSPSKGATSGSPTSESAPDFNDRLLQSGSRPAAAGTASATVRRFPLLKGNDTFRATAEIVEVKAVADTTVLHWRLISPDGTSVNPSGNWASGGTSSVDTSELVVIDPVGKQRLKPYLTKRGETTLCVCSDLPRDVDQQGVDLYATLPGLAAAATTVDIAIPQFPVIKGVPVTR